VHLPGLSGFTESSIGAKVSGVAVLVGVAVASGLALSVAEGVGVWVALSVAAAVGDIVPVAEGAVDAPSMGTAHAARLIVSRRVNIICLRMGFLLSGSFLNIRMGLYYNFLRLS